jgi:hypothetical protein
MFTRPNQTHDLKPPSNQVVQKLNDGKILSFNFADNRPFAIAQRKLHEMASHSVSMVNQGSPDKTRESVQLKPDDPREGFASNPLANWNPVNGPIRFPQRGRTQNREAAQVGEAEPQNAERRVPLLPRNAHELFNFYAVQSRDSAKGKCEVAAQKIGEALRDKGPVEYICLSIWSKDDADDPDNHYAVIFNGNVIDATAQQFIGMSANITPLDQWIQNLKDSIPPHRFCKYVIGGWADCKSFGNPVMGKYFWIEAGTPLYDYDENKVAKARLNAMRIEDHRQKQDKKRRKSKAKAIREAVNEGKREKLLNLILPGRKK